MNVTDRIGTTLEQSVRANLASVKHQWPGSCFSLTMFFVWPWHAADLLEESYWFGRWSRRDAAARTNRANRGCGALGRDLNSGWN